MGKKTEKQTETCGIKDMKEDKRNGGESRKYLTMRQTYFLTG